MAEINVHGEKREIKPCPFCGSTRIDWCIDEMCYLWPWYYIACDTCECRTGNFDTIDDAIEAWEKRVPCRTKSPAPSAES